MKRQDAPRRRQAGEPLASIAHFGRNDFALALAKSWAESDAAGRPRFVPLPSDVVISFGPTPCVLIQDMKSLNYHFGNARVA